MAEVTPLCLVCGDKSSGRHYGILTCDGCRGFFKRSVRRSMGYICREKNKCIVDLNRRNQCQACRMQKCLTVGMKKEAVQHERAPRLPKNRVHQFSPYPRIVDYSQMLPNNDRERGSLNRNFPPSPPDSPKQTLAVSSSQDLYQISVRLLYQTINWARNIPTFMEFPLQDQALLLESGWCGLFLLSLSQWKIPLESQYLADLRKMRKNENKEGVTEKNRLTSVAEDVEGSEDPVNNIAHLQSVIQKFKSMDLDPIEFSYLKAIFLFNSNLRDIKDRQHVESLQDQAQILLQEYATSKQRRGRFGKLLLKVPLLLEFSHQFILRQFFKGSLDNINHEIVAKRKTRKSVSPPPSIEIDHDYNNNENKDGGENVAECEMVNVEILKVDMNDDDPV